jgi:hypothetical protein
LRWSRGAIAATIAATAMSGRRRAVPLAASGLTFHTDLVAWEGAWHKK